MISRLQMLHSALIFIAIILIITACGSTKVVNIDGMSETAFPYAEAGLTKRGAAAHLIDRFAFGARPDDIDRVVEMGLEVWLEKQLSGELPDSALESRLSGFKTLTMSAREIVSTYPNGGQVRSQTYREGVLMREDTTLSQPEIRRKLRAFGREKGYRPQHELIRELKTQKILRAAYSENQLSEILTDFWFNHFNVSITDTQSRPRILAYERDAIRPHALGRFRDMLGATAKHPAMLFYLDNAQSTAPHDATTTMGRIIGRARKKVARSRRREASGKVRGKEPGEEMERQTPRRSRRKRGINENYARELMELHTLGVDGGYTQQDVVEVSRAFTGWTVKPQGKGQGDRFKTHIRNARRMGFVVEGDFFFNASVHDAGGKIILGQKFPAAGGMDEGERILDMLARHPSTAQHLSRKLAVRFVSDTPSDSLIKRLSETFLKTDGNIGAMIWAIAASPEFWSNQARREKIKSPFELAISALRALNADVEQSRQLLDWIARMGQPLYAYQAPTGYPDQSAAWVNTGSLVNRMNFGLSLGLGKIRGVRLDLLALNNEREPESVQAALQTYAVLLLPERNLQETVQTLTPMVNHPKLAEKIDSIAPKHEQATSSREEVPSEGMDSVIVPRQHQQDFFSGRNMSTPQMLAQVVGVIIGSPEFQRR